MYSSLKRSKPIRRNLDEYDENYQKNNKKNQENAYEEKLIVTQNGIKKSLY